MTKTNAKTATATKAAKAKGTTAPKAAPAKKLTDAEKDIITQSSGSAGGEQHLVVSAGGETLLFPTALWSGPVREASKVGGSFKAASTAVDVAKAKAKSPAQMARGIGNGHAPHSAKAVADGLAKGRAANKADRVQAKGKVASDVKSATVAKKEVRKAEKAKAGTNRPYKALVKLDDLGAREGTWRRAMLECVLGNKDTDSAKACLAKNREFGSKTIDFRWIAAQKYIAFTD